LKEKFNYFELENLQASCFLKYFLTPLSLPDLSFPALLICKTGIKKLAAFGRQLKQFSVFFTHLSCEKA